MTARLVPTGVVRPLYHPWTPAIVLLAVAVGAATAMALSGGSSVPALWWVVIGLVSGYAVSGSV